MRGKSTTTQVLEVYNEILESVTSGNEVHAIYLDFTKAFYKVAHHLLLRKFETLGILGGLCQLRRQGIGTGETSPPQLF